MAADPGGDRDALAVTPRRRTPPALQGAIVVVALACMGWLVLDQWQRIEALELNPRGGLLAITTAGAVGVFLLDAYGWHLVLRAQQCAPDARTSIRIWMLSCVARYIPGGIWGYASRAALARDAGIGIAAASMSLYIETLLLAASSLAVGFPALLAATGLPVGPGAMVLILAALGLCLHPRALRLWARLPGRIGHQLAAVRLPSAGQAAALYLYYCGFWLLFAALFALFVHALHPLPPQSWLAVGASLPMGFMIGFIVVFVPGGIGLRESVIYVLLLPHLPAGACLLVAVASRIWLTLAELLALGVSLLPRRT